MACEQGVAESAEGAAACCAEEGDVLWWEGHCWEEGVVDCGGLWMLMIVGRIRWIV